MNSFFGNDIKKIAELKFCYFLFYLIKNYPTIFFIAVIASRNSSPQISISW